MAILTISAFEPLGQAPSDRMCYLILAPDGTPLTANTRTPLAIDPIGRFPGRRSSGPIRTIVGQTIEARRAPSRRIVLVAIVSSAPARTALDRAERRTEALNPLLDQRLAHATVNHRAVAVLHDIVSLLDNASPPAAVSAVVPPPDRG